MVLLLVYCNVIRLNIQVFHQRATLQSSCGRQTYYQQSPALLPKTKDSQGKSAVHQRDDPGKSVYPGYRRNASERNVVDLRVSQKVPGKTCNPGTRKIDSMQDDRRK